MSEPQKIRVAVNGYGVIGKRVVAAVLLQNDMVMAGVSDVVTDWRARMSARTGVRLFGATGEHASAMRAVGLEVAGSLDDLLGGADVVVDCTPKHVAARNIDVYRRRGLKFIVQGGEAHSVDVAAARDRPVGEPCRRHHEYDGPGTGDPQPPGSGRTECRS